jgi:hypothetical protein
MYQFLSLTIFLVLGLSNQVVSATETDQNNGQTPEFAKREDNPEIQNRIKACLRPLGSPSYIGDLPMLGNRWGQWSVKPAASVQVIKYDLASKQVSINKSLGAGASFHFYKNEDLEVDGHRLDVKNIKPECRASTFSAKDVHEDPVNGKIAYSLFSITPTIYASEDQGKEFSVQPAILVGVFRDLFNFGVGFNLTGAEKGHTFLLFSMGASF